MDTSAPAADRIALVEGWLQTRMAAEDGTIEPVGGTTFNLIADDGSYLATVTITITEDH